MWKKRKPLQITKIIQKIFRTRNREEFQRRSITTYPCSKLEIKITVHSIRLVNPRNNLNYLNQYGKIILSFLLSPTDTSQSNIKSSCPMTWLLESMKKFKEKDNHRKITRNMFMLFQNNPVVRTLKAITLIIRCYHKTLMIGQTTNFIEFLKNKKRINQNKQVRLTQGKTVSPYKNLLSRIKNILNHLALKKAGYQALFVKRY